MIICNMCKESIPIIKPDSVVESTRIFLGRENTPYDICFNCATKLKRLIKENSEV